MIEVIVNPEAGGGHAAQISNEIEQYLKTRGVAFCLRKTTCPGHATELARDAAKRGVQTVIACGGDGTVTETAAGLRGTQTALGILPCGTGNDFIKTAGIPSDWKAALDFIWNHPARPVNSGMMNDQFFLNECGTGFDVMVLDYAQKAKTHAKGIWPYLYGVLRTLTSFRPVQMHIEIGDDLVLDGKYTVCAIGNGRYIGGGIPMIPGADLMDGLLDVLVVDAIPSLIMPFYLPSLLMGTLHKKKVAHRYLVPHCKVDCVGMRLNMDGEIRPVESATFVCEQSKLLLHW